MEKQFGLEDLKNIADVMKERNIPPMDGGDYEILMTREMFDQIMTMQRKALADEEEEELRKTVKPGKAKRKPKPRI